MEKIFSTYFLAGLAFSGIKFLQIKGKSVKFAKISCPSLHTCTSIHITLFVEWCIIHLREQLLLSFFHRPRTKDKKMGLKLDGAVATHSFTQL